MTLEKAAGVAFGVTVEDQFGAALCEAPGFQTDENCDFLQLTSHFSAGSLATSKKNLLAAVVCRKTVSDMINVPTSGFSRTSKSHALRLGAMRLFGGALLVTSTLGVAGSAASAAVSRSTTSTGTVIANNAVRHTLAVANAKGLVSSWRLSAASKAPLGAVVTANTTALGDGTLRASNLTWKSAAKSVTFVGTVVRAAASSVTLSAGGSNLTVAVTSATKKHIAHAASLTTGGSAGAAPGSVLDVTASVGQSGLQAQSETSQSGNGLVSLVGSLSAISASSITINVDNGPSVTVAIPASITLPAAWAVGTRVEALVSWSNPTFTLVSIVSDSAAGSQVGQGVSGSDQSQNVHVEGQVIAADASSITVQAGSNAAAVVVAIPSTFTMPAVAIGNYVHIEATQVSGVLTLVSIYVHAAGAGEGDNNGTEVGGVVVAVSATALTLQPGESATPVTFVVPSTIDVSGINVGDRVHANGTLSNGTLTLVSFTDKGPAGSSIIPSEVDGQVTAVSPNSLTIQPGDNAPAVTLVVPSTVDVSTLAIGQWIRASVAASNGTLSLVSYTSSNGGDQNQSGSFNADGVVVSVTSSLLVISAGEHGHIFNIAVPSTVDVSAIAAGQRVHVSVSQQSGVLTLVSVGVDTNNGGQGGQGSGDGNGGQGSQGGQGNGGQESQYLAIHGVVASVSPTQLVVTLRDGTADTFVVPASVDVSSLSVGTPVFVLASNNAGTLTLLNFSTGSHDH